MNYFEKKIFLSLRFFLILLLFLFTPAFVFADYTDDTQGEFDSGTHTNTQWDSGNSWLEMDNTGLSSGFATFTSRIIDNGSSASWSTFSWVPQRPIMKELPDSDGVESAYNTGNVDMTSTTLLFHLNESSGNASDTSGSGITGTVTGATQGAAGKFNTAYSFDGGDYLNLGDVLEDSINGKFSISVWVYVTGSDTTESILSKYNSTSGKRQWMFRLLSSKPNITIYGALGGTPVRTYTTDATISLNAWHHLVFIGDVAADSYSIYVDGSVVAGTKGNSAVTSIPDSNEPVMLGGIAQAGSFDGTIDEIAVIGGRNLTATDVSNIYKRGALRFRYQVRSCDDSSCSGESFVGQSGSTSNHFEEQDNNTTSLPSFSLSGIASNNQYFQYRLVMETVSSTLSPELKSVTVASSSVEGGSSVPEFTDFIFISTFVGAFYFLYRKILPQYLARLWVFYQRAYFRVIEMFRLFSYFQL